jgi:hypothetical protein
MTDACNKAELAENACIEHAASAKNTRTADFLIFTSRFYLLPPTVHYRTSIHASGHKRAQHPLISLCFPLKHLVQKLLPRPTGGANNGNNAAKS